LEIRVLEYFLAVANEGSITKAAASMHVSQPNISRQLQELEEELGTRLFIRGNPNITLTEEGRLLYKRAQEMIDLRAKTKTDINYLKSNIEGNVYIGCGETEGMRFIAKAVKTLQDDCPNIHIHLYSGNAMDVLERLDKGLLDFGLIIGLQDDQLYDVMELPYKDTFGLLMRKDSPLASRKYICPKDFCRLPFLMSYSVTARSAFSKWLGKSFDSLRTVVSYNLINNAALMVEEGVGYALTFEGLPKTDALCFKPLYPRLELGISLVRKKHQIFSRASEKFYIKMQEYNKT
jgi:DNA-binding transcriptional LysR family regulator